jgi:hypothetical protein
VKYGFQYAQPSGPRVEVVQDELGLVFGHAAMPLRKKRQPQSEMRKSRFGESRRIGPTPTLLFAGGVRMANKGIINRSAFMSFGSLQFVTCNQKGGFATQGSTSIGIAAGMAPIGSPPQTLHVDSWTGGYTIGPVHTL